MGPKPNKRNLLEMRGKDSRRNEFSVDIKKGRTTKGKTFTTPRFEGIKNSGEIEDIIIPESSTLEEIQIPINTFSSEKRSIEKTGRILDKKPYEMIDLEPLMNQQEFDQIVESLKLDNAKALESLDTKDQFIEHSQSNLLPTKKIGSLNSILKKAGKKSNPEPDKSRSINPRAVGFDTKIVISGFKENENEQRTENTAQQSQKLGKPQ
jgi:hypothetical protein